MEPRTFSMLRICEWLSKVEGGGEVAMNQVIG